MILNEIKEQQNNKEQLREQIKKRVKFEEIAHYTVEDLILTTCVSETALIESCQLISPEQYEDVVEERSISNICGYPVCHNPPTNIKKKYHISLKDACVYDISKRKNFCSNNCYEASNFLQNQISSSPVWVRDSLPKVQFSLLDRSVIKGLIGEVVLEDRRKVFERELLTQMDDNSSSFVSVYDDSSTDDVVDDAVTSLDYNDDDNCISNKSDKEIELLCFSNNLQDNLKIDHTFDLNKKILNILKNKSKKLASCIDDLSVGFNVFETSYIMPIDYELKNEVSNSKHASLSCDHVMPSNNQSHLPENSDSIKFQRIRDRIISQNISKSILISQNDFIKSNLTTNTDNKQIDISPNSNKKLCLKNEALGSNHLINILKEYFVEWLNYERKIITIDKLNIDLQNKCTMNFNESNGSVHYKEDNDDYACKVKQFFENTQRFDDGTQVVLPNVDSHSQSNIQRQIVYKNIYNSMRFLSKIYGFNIDIISKIKEIVKHFNFNNKNILLNPKQWNLVTMVFIKFLIENKEISILTSEFEKSLTHYLSNINILEKQFFELYTLFTQS